MSLSEIFVELGRSMLHREEMRMHDEIFRALDAVRNLCRYGKPIDQVTDALDELIDVTRSRFQAADAFRCSDLDEAEGDQQADEMIVGAMMSLRDSAESADDVLSRLRFVHFLLTTHAMQESMKLHVLDA